MVKFPKIKANLHSLMSVGVSVTGFLVTDGRYDRDLKPHEYEIKIPNTEIDVFFTHGTFCAYVYDEIHNVLTELEIEKDLKDSEVVNFAKKHFKVDPIN